MLSKVKLFGALVVATVFVSGAIAAEMKCGAGGKCGGDKESTKEVQKPSEMKCGSGKCGGDKESTKEVQKPSEMKCGAGKCGGDKK